MALANVELSNTFNEFRTAHNLVSSTVNGIQDGTLSIDVDVANVATANITSIDSNLVPAANLTYNLGSPSNWWNDLYLSGSTIFIGDGQIKVESNTVQFLVNDVEVFTADSSGSIPDANSITANTVTINTLTSGRVALVGANGIITDDSGLTFDTSTDALTVSGNLNVTGNFTVTGNTTQLSINELLIDDPVVHLAANNETSDLIDIGFLGHYSDDAGVTKRHAGMFRDASDGRFYVFTNYVDANLDDGGSFTVFDIGDASFQTAELVTANLESNYITANGITINDYTLPTADGNANQIFITDGSGNVTFSDLPSSGITTGKAIAMAIVFGG